MGTRWDSTDAPRGGAYDVCWQQLAAAGHSIHGEADLVDVLLRERAGRRVLDAGCGTGRVAIELAARGYDVVGVDLDDGMLTAARQKAPELSWIRADLAALDEAPELSGATAGRGFDVVVLAGNVMIFLDPGTEGRTLTTLRAELNPGGAVVAGFQLRPHRLTLTDYDQLAEDAGLALVDRWSTWDRQPFTDGDYAVSVHKLPRSPLN